MSSCLTFLIVLLFCPCSSSSSLYVFHSLSLSLSLCLSLSLSVYFLCSYLPLFLSFAFIVTSPSCYSRCQYPVHACTDRQPFALRAGVKACSLGGGNGNNSNNYDNGNNNGNNSNSANNSSKYDNNGGNNNNQRDGQNRNNNNNNNNNNNRGGGKGEILSLFFVRFLLFLSYYIGCTFLPSARINMPRSAVYCGQPVHASDDSNNIIVRVTHTTYHHSNPNPP